MNAPHPTIESLKESLDKAKLAGFIYQHQNNILVLQEPLSDDANLLNSFIQHETTADQLGLQYGLKLTDQGLKFLVGITHSNQDRGYEIGAGNLKGEQKAFNLLYAFYNYPKAFHLVEVPLYCTTEQLHQAIEQQLFELTSMSFLNSAVKINPKGQQVLWMKDFILQQSLDMKVRIQTALL